MIKIFFVEVDDVIKYADEQLGLEWDLNIWTSSVDGQPDITSWPNILEEFFPSFWLDT